MSDGCAGECAHESGAVLHTITTPEDLATLYLEPTFAGSAYPFGAPIIAAEE